MPDAVSGLSRLGKNDVFIRFDEVKTVRKYSITISYLRAPLIFIMLTAMPGFSILPASGQNPWLESDKPLLDDRSLDSSEDNTWRDKTVSQPDNAIDESKYPPMDENETLGTDRFGYPAVDQTLLDSSPVTGSSDFQYPDAQAYRKKQYPDAQAYRKKPVYPDSRQRNMPGYYGNRQYPQYRPGYQSGYPDFQRGYGPGNGNMGGFPFGGGSGSGFPFGGGSGSPFGGGPGSGFPFGGGSGSPFGGGSGSGFPFGGGSGSPFGGGNDWMPFSNSGNW
jgi:uncharacterized membrane protein YgcG